MKPEPIGSMLKKGMEKDYELNEIYKFLKEHIPIILDIENQKLKYDSDNIYFKIYKRIYQLQEEKGSDKE